MQISVNSFVVKNQKTQTRFVNSTKLLRKQKKDNLQKELKKKRLNKKTFLYKMCEV